MLMASKIAMATAPTAPTKQPVTMSVKGYAVATPTSTPTPTPTLSPVRGYAVATTPSGPFTCTAEGCRGMNEIDLLFRTMQNLINMANQKLAGQKIAAGSQIAVNGLIDNGTVQAFLPISRAVGGTLAIIDVKADPKYLATDAGNIATAIAQWLGITWVGAAAGVPGHWERLRAGQKSSLPTMDNSAAKDPVVLSPLPEQQPLPPPPPPQQSSPSPPPPPSTMVMYVCPDGSRSSSPQGCPPVPMPVAPPPQQAEPPPPRSSVVQTSIPTQPNIPIAPQGRYAGCIARYNRTRKVYAIYCPTSVSRGLGLASEQFRCLYGNCGLGEGEVTPPPPSGMSKVAETAALPNEGETPSGDERDKFFRLRNPLMWLSFAGAAAAIGGGSYVVYRRKRRAA